MNKIHVIYISGLGDRYDTFRQRCLNFWNGKLGVSVTFVPMRWRHSTETADEKLERIHNAVRTGSYEQIVLIGESAGASAAFVFGNTLKEVTKVIALCGKIIRADRVSPTLYRTNSAFESMMQKADSVSRARQDEATEVVALYAYADPVVRFQDMNVKGVHMKRFPSFGHFFAIASALTLLWPLVIRTVKHK